jgi:putative Holliday junction resolvase
MYGRVLAIDVGARRVGLAISDVSCTLARPLETIVVTSDADAVDRVARRIRELADEEGSVGMIVVGMPSRLDGTPSPQTAQVIRFIDRLKARTSVAITTEGEQLSSREAESRLAARERDWRKRKKKLDAAAAAIILQDYLDRRS